MLDRLLINCCAPTLASLKSASLFSCRHSGDSKPIYDSVDEWNEKFEAHGIEMRVLRMTEQSALIYVYRKSSLARCLSDPDVASFLESYGYDVCAFCDSCSESEISDCNLDNCLKHLRHRICNSDSDFPHEIGVFLDYPLQDVKGFIDNNGRDFKMVGNWKVYGDEEHARKSFEKYEKCTSVYSRLWESGRKSLLQLTVAG